MNKLTGWEIFFVLLAVGIMLGVAIAGIGYAVNSINLDPQVHLIDLDGIQYACERIP